MDEAKLKALTEFRERTEQEKKEIGARLLSPLDEVYEIDFGQPIGTLHFRRITLEDRRKITEVSGDDEATITRMAEILAKYNADGQPKETWLAMAHGDRQPEFLRISQNLIALSAGGPEGMMEFFRALQRRIEDRSLMSISAQDTTGNHEHGH